MNKELEVTGGIISFLGFLILFEPLQKAILVFVKTDNDTLFLISVVGIILGVIIFVIGSKSDDATPH